MPFCPKIDVLEALAFVLYQSKYYLVEPTHEVYVVWKAPPPHDGICTHGALIRGRTVALLNKE